jgi:hypothetical protein
MEEKYEAYCFRCKCKKIVQHPEISKMKTGMEAVKGICPDCGGKLYKILPKNKKEVVGE